MSLDASLKSAANMGRHRNVLSRPERIAKLMGDEKWAEEKNSVFGLPKVGHRKQVLGKVKAEAAEGDAAATPGAAPAAAAAAAKPAAAAAAKAPAAAAAPAAKKK